MMSLVVVITVIISVFSDSNDNLRVISYIFFFQLRPLVALNLDQGTKYVKKTVSQIYMEKLKMYEKTQETNTVIETHQIDTEETWCTVAAKISLVIVIVLGILVFAYLIFASF